ncbi:hypothetical protein OROMI_009092 [Orobanche minor]
MDFYDISLVNGFNLPLVLEPSDRCQSTGCPNDLNQICPSELRTQSGLACRGRSRKRAQTFISHLGMIMPHFHAPTEVILSSPFVLHHYTKLQMPLAQSPDYSNIPEKNGKNHFKLIIIVVALSIACVVIVISIILLCFLKRRRPIIAKLCKKKQSVLSVLGTRGTIGYGMMILQMAVAKKIKEANTLQSSEIYFPDKIYEHAILGVNRNLDGLVIEEEKTEKMFMKR